MHRPVALALLVLLLAACDDKTGPDDDDTSTPDDTGPADDTGDSGIPEEGCITVDGKGGYAWMKDAIRLASEGSVIEVCAGKFYEAVSVDKSVTIVGAGRDATIWSAPEGEALFHVEGVSGVTIEGIGLDASATAIEVVDATDVVLTDLSGSDFGIHAVWAQDTVNLTVSNCTFYAAQEGAILVVGGSAEISECNLVNHVVYAVAGAGDADLVVRDNAIRGTTYSEKVSGGYADGFGVLGNGAESLTLEGNTFTDNAVWSVRAQDTDTVSLSGDEITGGMYGVYQIRGDLSIEGATITDPTEFGVLWVGYSSGSMSVTDCALSGDPDVVSDYSLDEIEDDGLASVGLYAEGNDITVSGTSITGWNDAGIWMASYNAAGGQATLSDVTLDDNGRRGLLLYALDAVATNVTIRNLRQVEKPDTSKGFLVNFPAAAALEYGTTTWTGGALMDNEGWGISNVLSEVTVSGATFSANTYSAFIDFQGTSVLDGNTFTASASTPIGLAAIWVYENESLLLQGNRFADNTGTYTEDMGGGTTLVLHGVGTDVTGQSAVVEARDNTFENGNQGLYMISSSLVAEGNTWSGYSGYDSVIVRLTSGGSATVTLTDNAVDGYGGYLLDCYGSTVGVEGLSATDQGPQEYTFEYWEGGKKYASYPTSSPVNAFYLTSGCEATLADVDIQGTATGALYAQDSVVRMDAVSIGAPAIETGWSSDVVYAYWSSRPAEFYATDVLIVAPAYNDGMNLQVSSFYGTTAMDLTGVTVQSVGTYGISISGATATVTDADVTGSASSGLYASSSTVTVSGGSFTANGSHGAEFWSSTADVRDATLSDNDGSGLVASASSLAAVGNTITGNAQYGISCQSSSTVTECGNDISGNGAGDNDGCDASCDTTP